MANETPIEFRIGSGELQILDRVKQLFGVEIKYQGIWQVHQNDLDNFPSDFHAHRKDKAETLDLYTGDVYDPRTRKYLRTVKEKHMRTVYEDLGRKSNSILDHKLNESGKFSYLRE
jgi:hemerythrin superfamily protein